MLAKHSIITDMLRFPCKNCWRDCKGKDKQGDEVESGWGTEYRGGWIYSFIIKIILQIPTDRQAKT